MALGIQRLHFAAVEIEPLLIPGDDEARLVYRLNVTVQLAGLFNAVNRFGPGDQSCRVCHVQSTARMNNTAGIRQRLHKKSRATGMVEVNVREEDEIDVLSNQIALPQSIDQERHAVIRSSINEGSPAAFNDQVASVLQWPRILGIDSDYAIVKLGRLGVVADQALFGLRCFETVEAREIFSQKCNVFFCDQCGLCAHQRILA